MAIIKFNRIKVIFTDIAGILMIIGAILFGWIPGPGGIPLLLGGIGLLSINHAWARKLLQKTKDKGSNIYDVVFPDNSKILWVYDVLSLSIVGLAIIVITKDTKNLTQNLAIATIFVSVGLLITNRRRLEKISNWVSKKVLKNKA